MTNIMSTRDLNSIVISFYIAKVVCLREREREREREPFIWIFYVHKIVILIYCPYDHNLIEHFICSPARITPLSHNIHTQTYLMSKSGPKGRVEK